MEKNIKEDSNSRRGFLQKSSLLALAGIVGSEIPFARNITQGFMPVLNAAAVGGEELAKYSKNKELIVLGDRPFVADTPPHLLNDDITPFSNFFVRNNGVVPESVDAKKWTLTIGEANGKKSEGTKQTITFTIDELKKKFKHYTYTYFLECAGNGRSEFNPTPKGNQWLVGGVSFGTWTGVRLKDVLAEVGVKENAKFVAYYGMDTHLSGDDTKDAISRGFDMKKAFEDETIIAWSMNGADLPIVHGAPLRLMGGGMSASVCGKWLKQIVVRDIIHDGAKMVDDYRVPCTPIEPGSPTPKENMCVVGAMPVKSLITYPQTGLSISLKDKLNIKGQAWCGTGKGAVKAVFVSMDFGQTWLPTKLTKQKNKFAPHRFTAELKFPMVGYYEVWARAVNMEGVSQPMVVPNWSPNGYMNNATHRIAVKVV